MYHQMIYRSRFNPTAAGIGSTVRAIVAASERNNTRDRITGYLVFDKAYFMQILEGDQADVKQAFDRIARDGRHCDLVVLYTGEASKRTFPEWSMGGAIRSPEMQAIFAKHGYVGALSEAGTNDGFIALARDIADWEAARQLLRGLSPR